MGAVRGVRVGVTEAGETVKGLPCPQCKRFLPLAMFQGKPYDCRCLDCIPHERREELADKVRELALRKASQVMDLADQDSGLQPVEKLLSGTYSRWGGYNAYIEDLVEGVKRLYDTGKVRDAVNAQLRLLQLHTKIDKMRQEEEWHLMDDITLKAMVRKKLAAMIVDGDVTQAMESLDAQPEVEVLPDAGQ